MEQTSISSGLVKADDSRLPNTVDESMSGGQRPRIQYSRGKLLRLARRPLSLRKPEAFLTHIEAIILLVISFIY